MADKILSAARADFFDEIDNGANCPCCDRFGKRYKRTLNSTIGHALLAMLALHERTKEEWLHVSKIRDLMLKTGCKATHPTGEIGKAVYYALVEQKENEDTKKRKSGLWRLTSDGMEFARGESTIPRFIYLYNDELHGERFDTSEFIYINDVLGKKFDYTELMESSYDQLKSTKAKAGLDLGLAG